eukprot:scaffold2644_cov129-Cylindrotheca_fusiformis.AAC.7
MLLTSRRDLLSAGSLLGILSLSPLELIVHPKLTIADCADLICTMTPPSFRESVKMTQHFLYRGGDLLSCPNIASADPDLLVEGTYEDITALAYFECLENELGAFPARPSTGHVATSDPTEASKWGDPVSVWPLGTSWAYAWPRERNVFFPPNSNSTCRQSDIVLSLQLEQALLHDREVLFASWFENGSQHLGRSQPFSSLQSAFLTIPMSADDEVKRELKKREYGIN